MHDWRVMLIVKATGKRKIIKASQYLENEGEVRKAVSLKYGDHVEIESVVDIAEQD